MSSEHYILFENLEQLRGHLNRLAALSDVGDFETMGPVELIINPDDMSAYFNNQPRFEMGTKDVDESDDDIEWWKAKVSDLRFENAVMNGADHTVYILRDTHNKNILRRRVGAKET